MTENVKPARKPRAPRHNFAEERAKLVMHCNVSIALMNAMVAEIQPPDHKDDVMTHVSIIKQVANMSGQITALKAVLALMGEGK